MLRVAIGALRSRHTQSVTLGVLAALVAAAAVAAPFYVYAAGDRLSAYDIGAAPRTQRLVTLSLQLSVRVWGAAGITRDTSTLRDALVLPGFAPVDSVRIDGTVSTATGAGTAPDTFDTSLADRDGVCTQVVVTGRCPTAAGEAMISTATAATLAVSLGATVTFVSDTIRRPAGVHVVGIYRPRDAADPYWGVSTLAADANGGANGGADTGHDLTDAIFVTRDTIVAAVPTEAVIDRDLILPTAPLAASAARDLGDEIVTALGTLPRGGVPITSTAPGLTARVAHDMDQIYLGVPLGAAQLVLLGWFALFLAVRATAIARRADVGILKLRGVPRRALWFLMIGQSGVPVLVGAPFGAAAGYAGARLVAGAVSGRGEMRAAIALAAAAGTLAIVGGLLAALAAERRTLATPIADLLRTTPSRRRGWRGDVADLVLFALAVAGVVQLHSGGNGATPTGLAALSPGLVALAAGLLAARTVVPLAARAVDAARRAGRVRAMLTAAYLARRPGLDRVFALVAIAVALAGYAIASWTTSAQARLDRAELTVGADQVITVAAVPPARLRDAVRAADPSGRYAMAVTEADGRPGSPSVLALDSARLAAVLPGGVPGGRSGAELAAILHPVTAVPPRITGTSVQLNAAATGPLGAASYLLGRFIGPDGRPLSIVFGPLRAGEHVYTSGSPTCAPGCALRGFSLARATSPGATSAAKPAGSQTSNPTGGPISNPTGGPISNPTGGPISNPTGSPTRGPTGNPTGDPTSGPTGGLGSPVAPVLSQLSLPTAGVRVVLRELRQLTPDASILTTAAFATRAAWRATADPGGIGPSIGASDNGLSVTVPAQTYPGSTVLDPSAYVIAAPVPAPVVVAGALPGPTYAGLPTVSPFGLSPVPVLVADREPALPRLQTAGYLIDLGYATELAALAGGPFAAQVWLAPGAPPGVLRAIAAQGLVRIGDQRIAATDREYAQQAAVVTLRFQLLGAAIGLALAAVSLLVVAAVERDPRAGELVSLRHQGVSERAARAVARRGYVWLAAGALLAGLIGAVVDRLVVGRGGSLFADGWAVLPRPPLIGATGFGLVAAAGAVTLGIATWLATRELVQAVRDGVAR